MRANSLSDVSSTTIGSERARLAAYATVLGSALIFLVGFAPLSAVHNAAHDTRHAAAFPCH
jgi:cobalt transporter subunit CbtB